MTLANKITTTRLLVAPIFFLIFSPHSTTALIISLLVIIYSEISDAIDGYFARKRNETTDFGKLYDPFSDSIVRFTYFVTFWREHLMLPWMVLLIFYRDVTVSFVRVLARGENVVVSARKSGKRKAMFQAIGTILVILLCFLYNYGVFSFKTIQTISYIIMFIVTAVTVWSAFDYVFGNLNILKKIPK